MHKIQSFVIFSLILVCVWLYLPYNYDPRQSLADQLTHVAGFNALQSADRMMFTGVAVLFSAVFAYATPLVLHRYAFGLLMNFSIAILSIFVALSAYADYNGLYRASDMNLFGLLLVIPPFIALSMAVILNSVVSVLLAYAMASGRVKKVPDGRHMEIRKLPISRRAQVKLGSDF